MKSKLKFGLDADNRAVIEGYIEYSEDLRDNVAQQFKQNFRHSGNLATYIYDHNNHEKFLITSFGGDLDDCKIIANRMATPQLENLLEAINEELKNRKV